jgi:hypothetical protein
MVPHPAISLSDRLQGIACRELRSSGGQLNCDFELHPVELLLRKTSVTRNDRTMAQEIIGSEVLGSLAEAPRPHRTTPGSIPVSRCLFLVSYPFTQKLFSIETNQI